MQAPEQIEPKSVNANDEPIWIRRIVKTLAVWNALTTVLVFVVAQACGKPVMRGVLLMAVGTSVLWIYGMGGLMLWYRERVKHAAVGSKLPWKLRFVLFCTALALLEEVVTVSMTNSAPLLGLRPGQAYITASANYLDVVCLHSVVVFVPMFACWAWMLGRWRFTPLQVLLLFGLTGLMAEISFSGPQSLPMFGFWIFVYGLMIALPVFCLPERLEAKRPGLLVVAVAPFLPVVCTIPVALIVSRLHPVKMHFPPIAIEATGEKAAHR